MWSRWLLAAPMYDAVGLSPGPEDAATPRRRPLARDWPVADGPASRALDALLRPFLPAGTTRRTSADYGDAPGTAATIRYRGPNGGYLRVVRRRLRVPLLLDGLADRTQDTCVHVHTPSGADVLRNDDDAADRHRLVLVRPDGTLFVLESIGMPSASTRAPVSGTELDELATVLDDPRADVEVVTGPS